MTNLEAAIALLKHRGLKAEVQRELAPYRTPNPSTGMRLLPEAALQLLDSATDDEIAKAMAPTYAKHFTLQELIELEKFAATAVGQKLWSRLIPILQEDAQQFQTWIQQKLGSARGSP